MRCQNAHAYRFLYFKYVLPAGPIATSFYETLCIMHNGYIKYRGPSTWRGLIFDEIVADLKLL